LTQGVRAFKFTIQTTLGDNIPARGEFFQGCTYSLCAVPLRAPTVRNLAGTCPQHNGAGANVTCNSIERRVQLTSLASSKSRHCSLPSLFTSTAHVQLGLTYFEPPRFTALMADTICGHPRIFTVPRCSANGIF